MKSSLEIHLGKCAEKFVAESDQYGIKRKVPKRPEELDAVSYSHCIVTSRINIISKSLRCL